MDEKTRKPASFTPPDLLKDVPDSVTAETLGCALCIKLYKITPQELKFYRAQDIPLPRHCPDCRYDERLTLRNPRKLWERTCMKCAATIKTTYAPERQETVYCEKCYLEAIY